ncbi:winged helix-turn-helix transcriptional regulator [Streptomyces sp. NPDC014870]|uniref:winged helix-turn-helix transcriptional regulator n=1 Tax=Streptomyces sp. NPDC014870 TaxID=3364925 RepID=UPI0036FDFC81
MARGKIAYGCGLDAAVDVVGGKWKPLILWALHAHGTTRFGELRRRIVGVSEKVLIQQLRELEADRVVHREVYPEVPPRVEYSLTALGQALNTALLPLGDWGETFMAEILAIKEAQRADADANGDPGGDANGDTDADADTDADGGTAEEAA